jgi:cytochrome c peroxidase
MHMPIDKMIERLKSIKEYKIQFEKAFPNDSDPITSTNVAKALATFERTVISGQAPFDTWINGDEGAISESAKRGFLLFNTKGRCALCHSDWNFSDGSFHDIGIDDKDIGRGQWLSIPTMQHAFKTMGLRNIDRRAPYMHNGSLQTLADVVDHYDNNFVKRDSLDDLIVPLHLTDQEKADLITFLKTLTSVDNPVAIPNMPK